MVVLGVISLGVVEVRGARYCPFCISMHFPFLSPFVLERETALHAWAYSSNIGYLGGIARVSATRGRQILFLADGPFPDFFWAGCLKKRIRTVTKWRFDVVLLGMA